MNQDFRIIIPARLQSTRLAGKLLLEIQGMSVLQRVWHQAQAAEPLSLLIATDSEQIAEHAQSFGAEVCMTDAKHPSGTDRLAEVCEKMSYAPEEIIVNVQGDEPFLAPCLIRQVAQLLHQSTAAIATLCWPIERLEDLLRPEVVKVVWNQQQEALYFSRSPIPHHRDNPQSLENCWRHIGLYAYRASFLREWPQMPTCPLEQAESLEQLRALWAGYRIQMATALQEPMQDINTKEDLQRVRILAEKMLSC